MNSKQERRFWKNVEAEGREAAEACWEWVGECRGGYGRFFLDGRKQTAHRVIWEHRNGMIPEGIKILHHCDNPSCVRLGHLFSGTQSDNVTDCASKGRIRLGDRNGEKHPLSKLTNAQAAEIRGHYTGARGEIDSLASHFGVNRKIISRIVHWKSYTPLGAKAEQKNKENTNAGNTGSADQPSNTHTA